MARSNNSGSFVVTAPPSPAVIVLLSWKLLMPMSPMAPTYLPL